MRGARKGTLPGDLCLTRACNGGFLRYWEFLREADLARSKPTTFVLTFNARTRQFTGEIDRRTLAPNTELDHQQVETLRALLPQREVAAAMALSIATASSAD